MIAMVIFLITMIEIRTDMVIVKLMIRSSFSALQAVCESCYQLYREPEVHSLCRSTRQTNTNTDTNAKTNTDTKTNTKTDQDTVIDTNTLVKPWIHNYFTSPCWTSNHCWNSLFPWFLPAATFITGCNSPGRTVSPHPTSPNALRLFSLTRRWFIVHLLFGTILLPKDIAKNILSGRALQQARVQAGLVDLGEECHHLESQKPIAVSKLHKLFEYFQWMNRNWFLV